MQSQILTRLLCAYIPSKLYLTLFSQAIDWQQLPQLSVGQLVKLGFTSKQAEKFLAVTKEQLEADVRWLQAERHHLIPITAPEYPSLLKEIYDPPLALYAIGDIELLTAPQLAIVGSRNPTASGRDTAFEFAKALAGSGLVITSGLALGVDAASHEGALAAGGQTIAVCGTGLDRVYPARHRDLARQIACQGLLLSEFPLGTAPQAQNFPMRNRIISGLSVGTLVVEAALRSGSLITARSALQQGREVFAIPGSIHNPLARGCHSLLKNGAKLVETADDVLEELASLLALSLPQSISEEIENSDAAPILDEEHYAVLENVGYELTPIDLLVERTGFPVAAVASMLLMLELQGLVQSATGGYQRV
jgi:DNA processing protein